MVTLRRELGGIIWKQYSRVNEALAGNRGHHCAPEVDLKQTASPLEDQTVSGYPRLSAPPVCESRPAWVLWLEQEPVAEEPGCLIWCYKHPPPPW